MPAVQPPAKVLVSGVTGYMAAWVVKNLLQKGYTVRGTARSVAKENYLKKLFASYGDRFELVVVEDMAKVSRAARRYDIVTFVMPVASNTILVDSSINRPLPEPDTPVLCARPFVTHSSCRTVHSTKRSRAWMP
jgi:nucleoside-diphosphate-sugar epimerase